MSLGGSAPPQYNQYKHPAVHWEGWRSLEPGRDPAKPKTLGRFLLLDQGFPFQAFLQEVFPSSPLVFPDSRERFQRQGKAGAGRSYLYLSHITAPRL